MEALLLLVSLFYVVFVIALPFVVWRLFRRLNQLERHEGIPDLESTLAALTRRVWQLEQDLRVAGAPSPKPADEAVPAPQAAEEHVPEVAPVEAAPRPIPFPEIPAAPAPAEVAPAPQPPALARAEWETVVGASWLNKLGVLVLVVGLSLFLGYSLRYFGPAGRVAIGVVVSAAMLVVGILLERKAATVAYGGGLIGGGWAGLYFTAYAAHGLPAARIIADPLLGIILLAAVAVGMIGHSLRYRSEALTGLAYFIGFVTLGISPVTGFSVIASVPLAGSLLFLSHRFSWTTMRAAGLAATYGLYALRRATEPQAFLEGDFLTGLAVLALYWLMFETADLLDIRKGRRGSDAARLLMPLNAVGFIGTGLLHWMLSGRSDLHVLSALAAAAYLTDALLRGRLLPPSSLPAQTPVAERVLLGGYELPITLAAGFAAYAVLEGLSGLQVNLALILEAEALFIAGFLLRLGYLRTLGAAVFALSFLRLPYTAWPGGPPVLAGHAFEPWAPVALLTAGLLYANRAAFRPGRAPELAWLDMGYGLAATILATFVLWAELPAGHLGFGWLLYVLVLLELGLRDRFSEFRLHAAGVAVLAYVALGSVNVLGVMPVQTEASPWLALGGGALLSYAAAFRLHRLAPGRLAEQERWTAREIGLGAGAVLVAALLWKVLPTPLVAVGWAIEALLLIEAGCLLPLASLRLHGHLMLALAFGRLFMANFTLFGETAGISHRMLTVAPFIVLFLYLPRRLRRAAQKAEPDRWERGLPRLYGYAPALLAAVLLRFELGRTLTAAGWSALALGLIWLGRRREDIDLRWQGQALAGLAFLRCWATNFYIPESLAGLSGRVATGGLVILALYAAHLISSRPHGEVALPQRRIARWFTFLDLHAREVLAVLASVLLAALLFYELPGRLLTVAWAVQGALLLAAGFLARERILRLLGLTLLFICIFKVFVYDLRELETVFRILSFVVLGLLLLGVSWVYTRYRDKLRRYL